MTKLFQRTFSQLNGIMLLLLMMMMILNELFIIVASEQNNNNNIYRHQIFKRQELIQLLSTSIPKLDSKTIIINDDDVTKRNNENMGEQLNTFRVEFESLHEANQALMQSETEDELKFSEQRVNVDLIRTRINQLRETKSGLLNFAIYYETLCPYSMKLFNNGLSEAFLYQMDLIDVNLIPYGNANVKEKRKKKI